MGVEAYPMGGQADEATKAGDIVVLPLPTPIGRLLIAAASDALIRIELPRNDAETNLKMWLALHAHTGALRSGVTPILKKASKQLEEYFTAGRTEFDLPLQLIGTEFQVEVWNEVRRVPFGATRTYGDIAAALGNNDAVRAVGAAQAANPLPIVVPCHRIVGAGGKLTGYAGGLATKKWLLEHEATTPRRDRVPLKRREPASPAQGPSVGLPPTPSGLSQSQRQPRRS